MSVPAMAAEVSAADAVPNTSAARPSYTANPNPLNTPPSPGLITSPQSPKGSSDTAKNFTNGYNYVNTISSTARYLAASLNVANVGKTPSPAKN